MSKYLFTPCEICPLQEYCTNDEDHEEIGKAISYRDRAVITEQEFADTLGSQRLAAVDACEEAQFVLKICGFSE